MRSDAPPGQMDPLGATKENGHAGMAGMPGMAPADNKAGADAMLAADAAAMPEHSGPMVHGLATPWAHFFAAIVFGVWLITSPFALDYRSTALTWSDIVSGTLIIALAAITLVRGWAWAPWANSLVGVWLLFAPLIFWAPTAAASTNDTLAGVLVIVFVILMPGMPGMRMVAGPDRPPGWSYNPSSWPQRAPIIALAFVGFFLSRHAEPLHPVPAKPVAASPAPQTPTPEKKPAP